MLTPFSDIAWNAPFYSRLGFQILPPEEQSPMLKSILLREADAGMQSRVAMFHDLAC